jgi:hypothetical protein
MIILRTTSFSTHTASFAGRLSEESGHRVCIVIDETRGEIDVAPFEKISMTRAACERLGLFCPSDFGWRCGDYGFYLARQRYPDEAFIWQIEYDVRLSGSHLDEFFSKFNEAEDVDMIAGHYRQADRYWFWTHAMAARGELVWRCLFPVVRLSAKAIDTLFDMRLHYAKQALRRAEWPNDESFVATISTRAGLRCADINDFGVTLYDDESYSFHQPLDGYALEERARPLKVFHPVLFDGDLQRKIARMQVIQNGETMPLKIKRRLIHALNRRLPA